MLATTPAGDRARVFSAAVAVVVAFTAVGLALRIYQIARPGMLFGVTEYDDGVYFGSAVRLVHGALPYRDYVLVQPPGITVLLAPMALLAKTTGTRSAFAGARLLTACAGAASVPFAGRLVRGKGVLAATLACGIVAVFPGAIDAAHTVLLEPWLVLLCLLGALLVFDGDEPSVRPGRLTWGGAAFGLAIAIKLWALVPALVVAVLCLRAPRGRAAIYLAGLLAGFCVPVLPFALAAPHAFVRDVVSAQLSRIDVTRLPLVDRLTSLMGLSAFAPVARSVVVGFAAALGAGAIACAARASMLTRGPPPSLEWFALASMVLVAAALLWPVDFYPHYSGFFAPFLALGLALPAARLTRARPRRLWGMAAGVAGAVAAGALLLTAGVELGQQTKVVGDSPGVAAQREIPAGSCVLTDVTPLTLVSNRFVSAQRDCSLMVDGVGTDYALSDGRNGVTGAGRTPAVQAIWLAAFTAARYVWLECAPSSGQRCLTDRRIPWTRPILGYFVRDFERVRGAVRNLYVRRLRPLPRSGAARSSSRPSVRSA